MSIKTAYYNDCDKDKCAWLRELIKAGAITDGDVDNRKLEDVRPADVVGYGRVHLCAGIGVWDYALDLAGWGERRVWTASFPCPGFSAAGKGAGFRDPRHLWPVGFELIRQCRPEVLFMEQVGAAIGHGWLDLVSHDMEGEDYAVGSAVLGACSVGAPHIRQRLYFIGRRLENTNRLQPEQLTRQWSRPGEATGAGSFGELAGPGSASSLDDATSPRRIGPVGNPEVDSRDETRLCLSGSGRPTGRLADAEHPIRRSLSVNREDDRDGSNLGWTEAHGQPGACGEVRPTNGFWADADWIYCRDGKYRPVEPGTQRLAHGAPARVVRLRGYGDAINAEAAAAFIAASKEAIDSVAAGDVGA